jgi:hypothetical protein
MKDETVSSTEAKARAIIDGLIDKLAAMEHQRWAHWQRYVHEKSDRQPSGALTIPAELVDRWERQIETPFDQLSEAEKESDRDQVRNYVPILERALIEMGEAVASQRADNGGEAWR